MLLTHSVIEVSPALSHCTWHCQTAPVLVEPTQLSCTIGLTLQAHCAVPCLQAGRLTGSRRRAAAAAADGLSPSTAGGNRHAGQHQLHEAPHQAYGRARLSSAAETAAAAAHNAAAEDRGQQQRRPNRQLPPTALDAVRHAPPVLSSNSGSYQQLQQCSLYMHPSFAT